MRLHNAKRVLHKGLKRETLMAVDSAVEIDHTEQ